MKKGLFLSFVCIALATSGWAVTVNQSGSGDFTSIQAAVDSGATEIVITDSATYDENVQIGSPSGRGTPVTITSDKAGAQRPRLRSTTPSGGIRTSRNDENNAVLAILSDGCVISNMILEGNPDLADHGSAAILTMGDNVTIENCLIQPMASAGQDRDINFPNSLVFVAQEGNPGDHSSPPDAKLSDGLLFKNCEFRGVHEDAVILPTEENEGFLLKGVNGNAATLARCDHYTKAGQECTVTFDGCQFLYGYDAGLFPSNRDTDPKTNEGKVTWVVRNCFFDSFGKFAFRGRGVHMVAECSVFVRSNQGNHGDSENSAIAIQTQDDRNDNNATITNCLFVNCGGAYGKKAYFGGCNNHNAQTMTIDQCTFVACLSGVSVGSGGGTELTQTIVRNSVFHQIGYNLPGAIDFDGFTIDENHPDLVDGLYAAWDWGIENFSAGDDWSAAFNHHKAGDSTMIIDNCLVGDIASEDTRVWDGALVVEGSRVTAGFEGPTDEVQGADTIIRGTPEFETTDLTAPNAYQLAPGSPGAGLGADLTACGGSAVNEWSVY